MDVEKLFGRIFLIGEMLIVLGAAFIGWFFHSVLLFIGVLVCCNGVIAVVTAMLAVLEAEINKTQGP